MRFRLLDDIRHCWFVVPRNLIKYRI
jgi:hypothetical protein